MGKLPDRPLKVRPAVKGASPQGIDPARMRRAVDSLVAVSGCRRKEARQRIAAWSSGGRSIDDIEAWLSATFRRDPTGVTAVRRAHAEAEAKARAERAARHDEGRPPAKERPHNVTAGDITSVGASRLPVPPNHRMGAA